MSHLNPIKIVQMKTTMFRYYNQFYRDVYDQADYEVERPAIMKFLIAAATDDSAAGLGMTRVGSEKTASHAAGTLDLNAAVLSYYMNALFDRYLSNIAVKYDLDLSEVRMIAALSFSDTSVPARQLADYAGQGMVSASASLEKLALKKYVRIGYHEKNYPVSLKEEADALVKEINLAVLDMEEACMIPLDESERMLCRKIVQKTGAHLKEMLKEGNEADHEGR